MTEREKLADELERLSKLSVAGEWTFEEHLDGILSIETAEPKLYDRKDVCQIGFDRTTRLKAESFAKLVIAMRNNLPTILNALREPPEPTAEDAGIPPGPYDYLTTAPPGTPDGRGHIYLIDCTGKKLASIWGSPESKMALVRWIIAARSRP